VDGIQYKMGWLLVAFDLPVGTKEQRKRATDFRKFLLEDGFQMLQLSVYARPLVSYARMETHIRRIKAGVPEEGSVRAMFITQAQWEKSFIIHGSPAKKLPAEQLPRQLELW